MEADIERDGDQGSRIRNLASMPTCSRLSGDNPINKYLSFKRKEKKTDEIHKIRSIEYDGE